MGDREVRIGTALRRMAEDLVAARRRVADLERENRRLRARLATIERPEDVMQSSRSPMEEPSRTQVFGEREALAGYATTPARRLPDHPPS